MKFSVDMYKKKIKEHATILRSENSTSRSLILFWVTCDEKLRKHYISHITYSEVWSEDIKTRRRNSFFFLWRFFQHKIFCRYPTMVCEKFENLRSRTFRQISSGNTLCQSNVDHRRNLQSKFQLPKYYFEFLKNFRKFIHNR